jgi:2-isopropylmalate synthase
MLALGAALAVAPRRTWAAAPDVGSRKFLFVFARGGWDPTFVFAPDTDPTYVDGDTAGVAAEIGGVRFVDAAICAGATTINLPDTVGYAVPDEYAAMFRAVRERVANSDKAVFSVHCHDDLGLAVANSLAGLAGGARQIECTINGLGERAGNADLCEVALALKFIYNVPVEIDLSKAREVSDLVQKHGKYTVDSWKPVVGKYIFTRESGGVASQFHMPSAIEPYSSDILRAKRYIALGKKSGLANIKIKLEELGLTAAPEKHAGLLEKVKHLGTVEKRLVTDDEFRAMVASA